MKYQKSYQRKPDVIINLNVTAMIEDICPDCYPDEVNDIAQIVNKRFDYRPLINNVQNHILDVIDELNPPD